MRTKIPSTRPALVLLAVVIAVTSCSDVTGPGDLASFETTRPDWPDEPEGALVQTSGGKITVDGRMATSTMCYTLSPRLSGSTNRITLTVIAKRQGGVCTTMPWIFRYSARIDVSPGEYDVIVLHDNAEMAPREILRTHVLVP